MTNLSSWLGRGYAAEHADRLAIDLREPLLPLDAEFIETTEYGGTFQIRGLLTGPNQRSLRVISIWMTESATSLTKFITRYPAKD